MCKQFYFSSQRRILHNCSVTEGADSRVSWTLLVRYGSCLKCITSGLNDQRETSLLVLALWVWVMWKLRRPQSAGSCWCRRTRADLTHSIRPDTHYGLLVGRTSDPNVPQLASIVTVNVDICSACLGEGDSGRSEAFRCILTRESHFHLLTWNTFFILLILLTRFMRLTHPSNAICVVVCVLCLRFCHMIIHLTFVFQWTSERFGSLSDCFNSQSPNYMHDCDWYFQ